MTADEERVLLELGLVLQADTRGRQRARTRLDLARAQCGEGVLALRQQRVHAKIERRRFEHRAAEYRELFCREPCGEPVVDPVGQRHRDGGRQRFLIGLHTAEPFGFFTREQLFHGAQRALLHDREPAEDELARRAVRREMLEAAQVTQHAERRLGDEGTIACAHGGMLAEPAAEDRVRRVLEPQQRADGVGGGGNL